MPIEVVRGCANVGGWLELSPYGWNASASMTGRMRPPARYAIPRSRRNVVGECVNRAPSGLSLPRGESPIPITRIRGFAALIASYVTARSSRNAGAAALLPSALNWGSQKRFRFGSLPTITPRRVRYRFTIEAAYAANCARSSGVSGVVRLPKFDTPTYTATP